MCSAWAPRAWPRAIHHPSGDCEVHQYAARFDRQYQRRCVQAAGRRGQGGFGYENRRETAKFSPDDFYTGGFGQLTVTAVSRLYQTNEVYAETLIPLFGPSQDIPACTARVRRRRPASRQLDRRHLDDLDGGNALGADSGRAISRQQNASRFAHRRSPSCSCLRRPLSSSPTIPATRISSIRARRRRRARTARPGIDTDDLHLERRQRYGEGHHVRQHRAAERDRRFRGRSAWCFGRAGFPGLTSRRLYRHQLDERDRAVDSEGDHGRLL